MNQQFDPAVQPAKPSGLYRWETMLAILALLAANPARAEKSTDLAAASLVVLRRVPNGGIQPQVAVDRKGIVHVVYFDGDARAGNLFYVRADDGATFTDPLRVNSKSDSAIAVGNIRGAQLAIGKNGRVHVTWNGSDKAKGGRSALPMLYARLNDAGTAFAPQTDVIQRAPGLDGGGSVAADELGNVAVVWHAPTPGTSGEARRQVWIARSHDEGKTFAREEPAWDESTGACGCCGLRAFADHAGNLYILYRAAREIFHRDTYLLVSKDQGRTFSGDVLQSWNVGTCPMSSFAFAESGSDVLAAWETDGQVYFTRLDRTSGRRTDPIAPPRPTGRRKHPVLAANVKGEILLAWTEGMGWNHGGGVAWQVFDAAGKPTAERGRTGGVPTWSLVAAYSRPDGGFVILY